MKIFSKINEKIRSMAFNFGSKAFREEFDLLGYKFLNNIGWHDVKAALAWRYWAEISVIWRSVNLISRDCSSIPPVIRNIHTKEIYKKYDPKNPATKPLKILKKPNHNQTYKEFMHSICASLLVTGETFIKSVGIKKDDIINLFWENPADINVISDGFYMPYQIILTNSNNTTIFTRNNKDYKYYSEDGIQQIYQSIDFNPFYKIGNQRGFSPLSSIYYDIEQYIKGSVYNINLLAGGSKMGGILTLDDKATIEQVKEIRRQLKEKYEGESNVGKIIVVNNGQKFTPINMTNRDMDYKELDKKATQRIYEIFEIPSSFFDHDTSTYNNKLNDRINLFIFAVLPMANKIFAELTKLFYEGTKYDGEYEIGYILRDIPALELMFDEAILRKVKAGVFTYNELRNLYGLLDIGTDGDRIYQALNLIAIGDIVEKEKSFDEENFDNKILKYDKIKKAIYDFDKS